MMRALPILNSKNCGKKDNYKKRDVQRVIFESGPLLLLRLPLEQILDELFICRRGKEAPPDGGEHLRARVVVRDRDHQVHQPHLLR